ncbi:MAG TPA: SusC/RagA family TonB-linked outer membrane protein [Bacteroidales bacterium]|nr:SusC/RagA family TonB-linked outer membrane protein [Bacteroidales bacterium]
MKYLKQIILILSFVLFQVDTLEAQKTTLIDVQAIVQNDNGNPVSGAVINTQEGRYYAKTDKTGAFTIKCSTDAVLTIEAKGYKTSFIPVALVPKNIALEKMPFQMSESDVVKVPFGSLKKRQIVGAISTIRPEDIEEFDATQSFSSALASRAPGLFGGKDIRGIGYTVIVDGIKRGGSNTLETYSDMLNLQEIAEVSILKDATSKALYGSEAEVGIILITTKRGEANKRRITVNAETGISDPISMPKFLNSANYMELFNEALTNDGLSAKYDQATIDNSRSGIDPYKYPNQDFYTSEFLKSYKPFEKVITEFSGGDSNNRYYLNLGYNRSGSLLNMGEGAKENDNRLNIRANIDIKLNKYISANIDAVSLINFYHSPNYKSGDFWGLASTLRPNDFTPLLPVNRIIAANAALVTTATKINNDYIPGGNSIYTQNLYGDMNFGGYINGMKRITQLNMGLNFDLGFIIPKLKYKTYVTYDNHNTFETYQKNGYAVYEPTFTSEDSISINKIGIDNFVGSQGTQNTFFYRIYGWSNILSYQNTINDINALDVVAMMKIDSYKENNFNYSDKHANAGIRINYMLRNKYVAEFSGSLVGSPRFDKGNRWGFAPVFGLAWIASEEEFLKSSSFLNYLKIKGTYGNIKTDIDAAFTTSAYYMYQNMFKKGGSFSYSDGAYSNSLTQIVNIGNSDLTWVERNELNLGAEASMLNNSLSVEFNYFNSKRINKISQVSNTFMQFLGGTTFLPFQNYGESVDKGFEFGINYEKRISDFRYNVGLNIVNINPILTKVDELNYGPGLEYRQKAGKASDAIWGWEAVGLFADDQDIASSSVQKFGMVSPGDIKYRDISGDGFIDDDDQTIIGFSHARYNYVLSINLSYKNLNLFTYLTAQTGRSSLYNNDYYWVSGELKYPEYLMGRWAYDPVNGVDTRATATYPRLSSKSNSNNFRNSSYWLYGANQLEIPVIQLTYTLPEVISKKVYTKSLSIFCRASDILMIATNKDRMQLNIGSEPQMRNYSVGLKAQF